MGIEFELKYKASPAQQEALLRTISGPVHVWDMETTYYDTRERHLTARRMTLRCRVESSLPVCTAKISLPDGSRGEWEWVSGNIHQAIPELCKLGAPETLVLYDAMGLEPVCGARFTRRAAEIVTADFTAELALDAGVLIGAGQEIPLCEVELELKSGSRKAMVAWMTELTGRFGLTQEKHSKFRRAMDLAEGVDHGTI